MRRQRWLIALLGLAACKGGGADVSLSKQTLAEETDELPNVPVPSEGGPTLAARVAEIPILERPNKNSSVLGTLLVGVPIARASEPYKKTAQCEGGYYPVRPRGFVCLTSDLALDAGHADAAPNTQQILPYRYASLNSGSPLYNRLPSPSEQTENEPDLSKHLKLAARDDRDKPLRAAAIDVPTDERGVPTGPPAIPKDGVGVGEDGNRSANSYFSFGDGHKPVIVGEASQLPLVASVGRRGSGLAIIGSFDHEGPTGLRRFAQTAGGQFVAVDRLDPELGTVFRGVELSETRNLPIAFVLRHEVAPYEMGGQKPERMSDDEVERRSVVNLSGRFRTVSGVRYDEAESGRWFRAKDIIKIVKRSKFPDFVGASTRWVDVSLALQTITLYEGYKPIYATLISSGQDVLGDPETSAATLQGTFTLQKKSVSIPIDPREVSDAFDVSHAPYALEYAPGFSFVGNYWSDRAGEARGYHNISLSPVDARRLYLWAAPEVPNAFRWYTPEPSETITVHIRK